MATQEAVTPPKSGQNIARKLWRNYYVQRVLKGVLSIYIVTTLTFFLIRLMPGNPLDIYISQQLAQGIPYQDAVQAATSLFQIDLNRPVYLQYFDYMGDLLKGDFGVSLISRTPVTDLIMRFLPWTLFVVTIALFISFVGGVLLGTVMAYKRNSLIDHVLTTFASIISAIPNYVIAMLIIVFFGVGESKLFSFSDVRGSLSPGVHPEWSWKFFSDALYHAALPIITYVLTTIGSWMLNMKSNTLSTLGEDYVNVAKARGLSDTRIATAYVGRNAVLPLFTSLAISIGFVVGGSTLIESIYSYAGIGLKLGSALTSRDYPVMQAIFIIICSSVVAANFLADFLYSVLDPRIRTEGR